MNHDGYSPPILSGHVQSPHSESEGIDVLLCSYISKQAHSTSRWKKRFCVLTSRALHWFKRYPADSLFGTELGSVEVSAIKRVSKIPSEVGDSFYYFEVEAVEEGIMGETDFVRSFRCESKRKLKEWVSAIEVAMGKKEGIKRSRFGSSNCTERAPVFPILLTRAENDIFLRDEMKTVVIGEAGSLPVTFGWNSKPIDLWGRNGILSWQIQLSNGQKITFAKRWLQNVEKGTAVEIAVDEAPVKFTKSLNSSNLTTELLENVTVCINEKKLPAGSSSNRALMVFCYFAFIVLLTMFFIFKFAEQAEKGGESGLSVSFVVAKLFEAATLSFMPFSSTTVQMTLALFTCSAVALSSYFSWAERAFEVTILKLGSDKVDGDSSDDEEENLKIPQRFIDGTVNDGGMPEAARRWRITRDFRKNEKFDHILHTPFPEFESIKKHYPLFYHGCTKKVFDDGNGGKCRQLAYFELPGQCNFEELETYGLKLVQKYITFYIEFSYTYTAPFEHSKILNIIDASHIKLTELKGNKLEMFKFISSLSQNHYPERASVIMVVNAPSWFSILFRLIKPFINETTQKKIRVYNNKETFEGLLEFLDLDRIPEIYGGTCKFYDKAGKPLAPWYGSECELAIVDYVRKLNTGRPLPRPPHFNREDVMETFENVEGKWEGDPAETLNWSDLHLPFNEQKSNWARSVRGLPLIGGGEINENGGGGDIVNESAEGTREAYDSSSDEGEIKAAAGRNDVMRTNTTESNGNIRRRDSTLALNCESDSESGYDSDGRDKKGGTFGGDQAASVSTDGYGFFATPDSNSPQILNVIHEGWIYKKATGEGWLGRRNWSPRWAKLVEADMPNAEAQEGGKDAEGKDLAEGKNVLLLAMFWYETSVAPSSWVFLTDCVTVPLDKLAEDWNSYCFECIHLPAMRQTRSFSALSAAHRDEWVSVINKTLSTRKEQQQVGQPLQHQQQHNS